MNKGILEQLVGTYLASADGMGEDESKNTLIRFAEWLEEEKLLSLETFVPVVD